MEGAIKEAVAASPKPAEEFTSVHLGGERLPEEFEESFRESLEMAEELKRKAEGRAREDEREGEAQKAVDELLNF